MRFHKKLSKNFIKSSPKSKTQIRERKLKILPKKKIRSSLKKIKIECFNCSRLGHVSSDWPSPKNIKKAI